MTQLRPPSPTNHNHNPTDPPSKRPAPQVDDEPYLSGLDVILEYINCANSLAEIQAVTERAKDWRSKYHDCPNPFVRGYFSDVTAAHPDLFNLHVNSLLRAEYCTSAPSSDLYINQGEGGNLIQNAYRLLKAHCADYEREERAFNLHDQYKYSTACILGALDLWGSPIIHHIPEVVCHIAALIF